MRSVLEVSRLSTQEAELPCGIGIDQRIMTGTARRADLVMLLSLPFWLFSCTNALYPHLTLKDERASTYGRARLLIGLGGDGWIERHAVSRNFWKKPLNCCINLLRASLA